jgi:8-oxo-dGTP pyrophosphatase MutT (NUDIX family)
MAHQHADAISCKVLIRDTADKGAVWLVHYTREGNHYGLPGGRMDEGETPVQAAQREVLEEIGAHVTNLQLHNAWLMPHDDRREGQDCLVLLFSANLVEFTRDTGTMSPDGELPVKIRIADIDNVEGLREPYKQAVRKLAEAPGTV